MRGMRVWSLFFLLVLFAGHSVWAQGSGLGHLDTNGDGRLDRQELERAAREVFRAHDRDGDGSLSREEFEGIKGARSRFEDLDADKNGNLDWEELKRAAEKRLRACDRDGDGTLTEGEILNCPPRPSGRRETAGSLGGQERAGAPPGGGERNVDPGYRPGFNPLFTIYF